MGIHYKKIKTTTKTHKMKTNEDKIKEIKSVLNILKEEYWVVDDRSNTDALTRAYKNLEKVESYLRINK